MAPKRQSNGSSSSSSLPQGVEVVTVKRRKVNPSLDSNFSSSSSSFNSRLKIQRSSNSHHNAASSSSSSSPKSSKTKTKTVVKSKPSARALLASEDASFESSIQSSFSTSSSSNQDYQLSKRELPLHLIHQRDSTNFKFPSLTQLCLQVAGRNWDTSILPSRETFDQAQNGSTKGKAKEKEKEKESRKLSKPKTKSFGWFVRDEEQEDRDEDYEEVSSSHPPSRNSSTRSSRRNNSSRVIQETTSNKVIKLTSDQLKNLTLMNHSVLKILPSTHLTELLNILIKTSPTSLNRQTLINYFLTSKQINQITLSNSLVLINENPSSISNLLFQINVQNLKTLELIGLTRLTETSLINLFRKSRGSELKLETFSLKGCVKIGDEFVEVLSQILGDRRSSSSTGDEKVVIYSPLKYLDLGFTDCSLIALESILKNFSELISLNMEDWGKLRKSGKLTDQKIPSMMTEVISYHLSSSPPSIPLKGLQVLKLGHNDIGDIGLASLLKFCGKNLTKLNLINSRIGSSGDLEMLRLGFSLGEGKVELEKEDIDLKRFLEESNSDIDHPHELGTLPTTSFNTRISLLTSINLSSSALTPNSLISFMNSLCNQDGIRGNTNLRKLNLSNYSEKIRSSEMNGLSASTFGSIINFLAGVVRRRFFIWRHRELSKLKKFLENYEAEASLISRDDENEEGKRSSSKTIEELLDYYFEVKDEFQDFLAFDKIDLSYSIRNDAPTTPIVVLDQGLSESIEDFHKCGSLNSDQWSVKVDETVINLLPSDHVEIARKSVNRRSSNRLSFRHPNNLDYFMLKVGWATRKVNLSGGSLIDSPEDQAGKDFCLFKRIIERDFYGMKGKCSALLSLDNLVYTPYEFNIRYLYLKDVKELDGRLLRILTERCGKLQGIYLGGTIETEDLDWVIKRNPFLSELDVAGCRSVPIRSRRSYLELYDSQHPR